MCYKNLILYSQVWDQIVEFSHYTLPVCLEGNIPFNIFQFILHVSIHTETIHCSEGGLYLFELISSILQRRSMKRVGFLVLLMSEIHCYTVGKFTSGEGNHTGVAIIVHGR